MTGMRTHARWIMVLSVCLAAASPARGQESSADGPRLTPDWPDLVERADAAPVAAERPQSPVFLRRLDAAGPVPLEPAPTPADEGEFCCDETHVWTTLGEIGLLLVIPNYFNRHVADDSTAVLSKESWERNIVQGMEWDADAFKTNMWMHPYHGNVYFNSARSNGYNFWQSAAWAWGGSFLWETFGENNRPAINDWAATAIGGIGLGETFNRFSRLIWDNSATGSSRTLRELGGFLVNPMGGFSRLVRGEWTKVGPNPEGRFPSQDNGELEIGFRSIGEGSGADASSGGFFALDYEFGDPFEDFAHPYDAFHFYARLNGSNEEQALGMVNLSGSLYGTELKRTETSRHVFHFTQHFDYSNTLSLETGGSSLAATFLSRWELPNGWGILARAEPSALLIWGVNSEYSDFTGRDYDFGSGLALRTGIHLLKDHQGRDDRSVFRLWYSIYWQHTLNGAIGDHVLQFISARLRWPLFRSFDVGATGIYTLRDSYYRDYPNVYRRFPEVRVYLGWHWL